MGESRKSKKKLEVLLSANPLLVLNNELLNTLCDDTASISPVKRIHSMQAIQEPASDEVFLSLLKQPRALTARDSPRPVGIVKELRVFSDSEIAIRPKRYYKFPFDDKTVNDQSQTFHKLSEYYTQALLSAYHNYRRFKERLILKLPEGLVFFDTEISCSYSLLKTLEHNDIHFTESPIGNEMNISIPASDVALIYDLAMNVEILPGMALPFILSDHEFENAIVYSTKVEKMPVVRVNGREEHIYTVKGPLYSEDYILTDARSIKYIN